MSFDLSIGGVDKYGAIFMDSSEYKRANWWGLAAAVAITVIAAVLMSVLRIYVVEPEAVAQACLSGTRSWQCTLRNGLVLGFTRDVFGITAVIVGLFAIVSRWRGVAIVAICSGVAGATLYRYELSGVGLLLGALTLARPGAKSGKQHADGERTA